MSKEEIHKLAEDSTPGAISVPPSWAGLAVWAIGKWGIGIVFLVLLIPVYQDLKESNEKIANITSANVKVLTALAEKVEISNTRTSRLEEALRRLEDAQRYSTPKK